MSNRLDDRIHALVTELVESAPEPPPFPAVQIATRQRRGSPRKVQRLALATLLLVFLVGSAVSITSLLSGGDNDSADVGLSGPDRARATTTTAAGASATTTTTTSAASATTSLPPVALRRRADSVVALDVECSSFAQVLKPLFAQLPDTPESYQTALSRLDLELLGIRTAIAILQSGDEYEQLTSDLDAVEEEVEAAQTAGINRAAEAFSSIDKALTELSSSLVSLGSSSCSDLATVIP